ncbi:MAG: RICIN domain-containing protein [Ruminococcus callidus]
MDTERIRRRILLHSLRSADGKTYYLNSVGEADVSNIEIRTNNKSSSHLFKFVKNPDGTYTILTRTSKDQAAVEVANAEKSSGANVQQWTVNGNACQKWNAVAFTTTTTTTTTTKATTTTAKTTTTTTKITSATSVSSTTVSGTTTAITEEPPAISVTSMQTAKAIGRCLCCCKSGCLEFWKQSLPTGGQGTLYADGVLNGFDLCLLRHTVTSSGNI